MVCDDFFVNRMCTVKGFIVEEQPGESEIDAIKLNSPRFRPHYLSQRLQIVYIMLKARGAML